MAAVAPASRVAGSARFALPVLAVGVGTVCISLATRQGDARNAWAGTSTAVTVAELTAGLSLLAAGAIAFTVRPHGSIGPVTTLAGVAWLGGASLHWEATSTTARSLALVASPFLLPLLAHLAFAWPRGHVDDTVSRVVLGTAYGLAAIVSAGRAAFRDPFLDPSCWSNCTDNVFLIVANPDVTRVLDALGLWTSLAVASTLVGWVAWRLGRATPVARRGMWFLLLPVASTATAMAAYAALLRMAADAPRSEPYAAVALARAGTLATVAVGVVWGAVRDERTTRAVTRLAEALGATPPPGSLGAALARTLGDDRIEVLYYLPGSQRYIDAAGRTVEPDAGQERAVTAIVRRGQPVALILHDRVLDAERDLAHEIGAAARLAVDNERLRAEAHAQLEELRASRVRLVDAADATRRRLERDLHDGAQQRVLAASYELRLASSAAAADADAALVGLLSAASEETQQTLTELRELARGIHPAILTEAGLGPALRTLADAAALPVELAEVVDGRYPAAVETTAYIAVATLVDDAVRRSATHVTARVTEDARRLVLELSHDGSGESSDVSAHLRDRVGALGGHLGMDRTRLRVELPCG